jgi:hypothetical protein
MHNRIAEVCILRTKLWTDISRIYTDEYTRMFSECYTPQSQWTAYRASSRLKSDEMSMAMNSFEMQFSGDVKSLRAIKKNIFGDDKP